MGIGEVCLAHACFQYYEDKEGKKKAQNIASDPTPNPNPNPDPNPTHRTLSEKIHFFYILVDHIKTHTTKYSPISMLRLT